MAAWLWLHLWHHVSEDSLFSQSGALFAALKSLTGLTGTWKWRLKQLSNGRDEGTFKMCWWIAFKKTQTKNSLLRLLAEQRGERGFALAIRHPAVRDLWPPKGRVIIRAKKETPLQRCNSSALLSQPLTSRLNVLAYCTSVHGWSEGRYFLADSGLAFILTLDANESRSALSSDSICIPPLLISEWS